MQLINIHTYILSKLLTSACTPNMINKPKKNYKHTVRQQVTCSTKLKSIWYKS